MPKSFIDKLKHYSLLALGFIGISVTYIFSVVWIFQSIESLIHLFSPKTGVFKFHRDIFIGFAGFTLFTSLAVHLIIKKIAPDKITQKHNNIMSKLIFISILLVFLPFAIEFLYDYQLNSEGYYVCEAATDRWLYLKTSYYTNSEQACIELVLQDN